MNKRVIISGGGTGGHIFPALAIANALKRIAPDTEILFIGANGRMEMDRVPAAGYKIIGLDIQGYQRGSIVKNLLLPVKMMMSLIKSRGIIKDFKPDVAVGVGGYASGPLLYAASLMKIPYLIQEQNSYAGVTNKILGKSAERICVAFTGMDKFFPSDKIMITGNPVRKEAVDIDGKREDALKFFGLSSDKRTILVTGGSLGAATLNRSMLSGLERLLEEDVQLIWQTGKYYYHSISSDLAGKKEAGIKVMEFLQRMDFAYAAADLIISRAGAGTIAELFAVRKPVVLVPSPNVAEDHQTKNAMALVDNEAAVLVEDVEAEHILLKTAIALLNDLEKCKKLSENIGRMALPAADVVIAEEVLKIAN
jgi:UDP-N-acetylglucosamine--N-acetylmuramyl-(pentapeptide) pyrophosphoryl-undecaprenol N-acetylglucosamine transferase